MTGFPDRYRQWHGEPEPHSPMFQGPAQPVAEGEALAEGKRVQIRSDHAVLVSLAQLAEESLAVQRHTLAALGASSESRSSATVKTSARTVDLECKSYDDGHLVPALDEAIAEYARGMRELAALQARNWQAIPPPESVMP
jgi:hypothetical protein